ncbi:uncharacterized protein LOC142361456 [Opisthocomus hoazin]|uniref:uncharacterized protein LOC142361456 n=1 Tax=Opisthocomus hoazin TaxID=30419 RepID=UPI003F5371AD
MHILLLLSLFWMTCPISVSTGEQGENVSRNLAWELIQGFTRIWNHTDQGLCIVEPKSAEESLRFFVTPINLSFVFNMTNVTSPVYLPRVWINKYDNSVLKWTKAPMVEGVENRWAPLEASSLSPYLLASDCKTHSPAFNVSIPHPVVGPESLVAFSNSSRVVGNKAFSNLSLTWFCEHYPWDPKFDPLKRPSYYEANYVTNLTVSWCVELPRVVATTTRDLSNLMWAWSRSATLKPFKLSPSRAPDNSSLFSCKKVITCNEGPGDPPETWFVQSLRALIRDMCTCWGYPSMGWKNNDAQCNSTSSSLTAAQVCGVPGTHYPVKGTPMDSTPKLIFIDYADTWSCKSSIYPAPLGLAWGCSDGKFYSYLSLKQHAGLRCGVVLPSLCPSRVFNYKDRIERLMSTPTGP